MRRADGVPGRSHIWKQDHAHQPAIRVQDGHHSEQKVLTRAHWATGGPADGPGHYREAERLLAGAATATDHLYGEQDAIPTLLAAMVHATLANAAATATGSRAEWMKAEGTRVSDSAPPPP